ncbi:MAG: GGDEF domain-containing protein [Gemmatimonadota bacterium]
MNLPSLGSASPQTLPSAFAQACRQSRSDVELFERCREALVQRFQSERIWFAVETAGDRRQVGLDAGLLEAVEVARCESGATTLHVLAGPELVDRLHGVAAPLALGLSVVLELRSVLLDRQAALDDAVFQLRALRQVARLLSSVHSTDETEQLVLDFMAEVFFAWWACLYRPAGAAFLPKHFRSLDKDRAPASIGRTELEQALPLGIGVTDAEDLGLGVLLPAGTEMVVPLDAGGERLALLLLGSRLNGTKYGRAERDLAATLSFAAAIALKNAELVERLQNQATTDDLTGLFNRRAIEERLDAEISRSNRHQIRTSIVLIDLDRFKSINDTFGHAAGDRYLVLVSHLLRQQVRTLDVVGRLGGDEFIVILPMTTPAEGGVFAGRVRQGMQQLIRHHPEFGSVSLSFGLAEAPKDGLTPAAVLAAADAALYLAKRRGGDQVVTAGET